MMAQALNLLFWGHLFVALRIDFGIDLLPDPLGYLFIAVSCFKLQDKFPVAQKTRILSVIMIFISLPTIFVNVHEVIALDWVIYSIILMILHLILVYFTFSIFNDIVKNYTQAIIERTQRIFTLYISIHLIQLLFLSFSMNVPSDISLTITAILAIITLIMTIVFLILIRVIRKFSLGSI